MLALVVAGGEIVVSERVRAAARSADFVIAADSGLRHLAALELDPDLVVGDFDSISPDAAGDAQVLRFPVAKDFTDAHLAVLEAVHRGADSVRILGALRGSRLDHGAANLLLLAEPSFRAIDLRAIDGEDELRAVRDAATIHGTAGDLVTLLALTDRASGITTSGLAYPLSEDALRRGQTRGVSNVLLDHDADVRLKRGILLLVHRDGGDPNVLTRTE